HDLLPYLHSFPTRRSSDLRCCAQTRRDAPQLVENKNSQPLRPHGPSARSLPQVPPLAYCIARPGIPRRAARRDEVQLVIERYLGDRKSTRLNSSHVKISYA